MQRPEDCTESDAERQSSPSVPAAGLTHVDRTGAAHMVDVGAKPVTRREAHAAARVRMQPETLQLIRTNAAKKGDVLAVARLAGIMAAKRTSELIPLCHQIPLSQVEVDFTLDSAATAVQISTRAVTEARTGVEMEALTAAAVAALTIYDMCKAVDRSMAIDGLQLEFKTGGASGEYRRP